MPFGFAVSLSEAVLLHAMAASSWPDNNPFFLDTGIGLARFAAPLLSISKRSSERKSQRPIQQEAGFERAAGELPLGAFASC